MSTPIVIPIPGGGANLPEPPVGDTEMSMDTTISGSLEMVALSQAQGHAFVMEQGRLNTLEGKMGMREGLSHRIITESGGGQSRSQQPAGKGGTPT